MIRRDLMTVNQNAIYSTMKLTGCTLKAILFNKPESNDPDERVVYLMLNNGDLLEEILEYFYSKHNLCLAITENINLLEMMVQGMYQTVNDIIDIANEDYDFDEELEILDYALTAPDEEFAKYFIIVREHMESLGLTFSRLPKSSDIFQLTYWMEVFADNFARLNCNELVLREEKYW